MLIIIAYISDTIHSYNYSFYTTFSCLSTRQLIEGGAEEHELVADFEHGIVFNCAAPDFMKSGGIYVYLRFVGDIYVSLTAQLATAH